MTITLALDAMGGDHGPSVTVPAAERSLQLNDDLTLTLVGDRAVLEPLVAASAYRERLRVHHASEIVAMDEAPALALRNKKDSSMRVAINLVKEGQADACVSAGNTGALMATARFVLKTLPGIDRPAIATALPTTTGHTYMLDLGANVDSSAEQLVQFAVMGSILVNAVDGIAQPSIGLLNIGAEAIKGNETVKQAAQLIADSGVNYSGYVEGEDIWTGKVDVVVCDGFVGNVALKTSEGVAHMVSHFIREEVRSSALNRLLALAALPIFKGIRKRLDPRRYNGASLLGLRGTVVKSHGSADAYSFSRAIKEAVGETKHNVPARISEKVRAELT